METKAFGLVELKLSLQGALLGAVTENLYGVTAGMTNGTVKINAFFYDRASEEDLEEMQAATTEVAADLPKEFELEENFFSLQDKPAKVLDFWAFLRASQRCQTELLSPLMRPGDGQG